MKSFKEFCLLEYISPTELKKVETYADKMFKALGITIDFSKHFMAQVNNKRDEKPIDGFMPKTISRTEVARIFNLIYKTHGKKIRKMNDNARQIVKDVETDVNILFTVNHRLTSAGLRLRLVPITIMRHKAFKKGNIRPWTVGDKSKRNKRKDTWRAAPDDSSWNKKKQFSRKLKQLPKGVPYDDARAAMQAKWKRK